MQVTIENTPAVFDKFKSSWQSLVNKTDTQPFFSLPTYQKAWWECFNTGELAVISVNAPDDQLVGLAPFYREQLDTHSQWRLLGAVDLSDYLDILVDSSQENEVFAALAHFLTAQTSGNDVIKLESIKATSPTLKIFSAEMVKEGWTVDQKKQDVCPVITLPKAWDEYLNLLPVPQQRTFKRLQTSIGEDDEISYRVISDAKEMSSAMPIFIALHKASEESKRAFWTQARETFFQTVVTKLAEENVVKLYFLDVNGQPAATLLIFDYENEFLLYNSGFDAYRFGYLGVGNALILHTIKEAITLGRSRYDFMRGDETYKFQFGAQSEDVYDLTFTRGQ